MADSFIRQGTDWDQRVTVQINDEDLDMTGYTGYCHLRPKGSYSELAADLTPNLLFDDEGFVVSLDGDDTILLPEGEYWFDVFYIDSSSVKKGTAKITVRVLSMVTKEPV